MGMYACMRAPMYYRMYSVDAHRHFSFGFRLKVFSSYHFLLELFGGVISVTAIVNRSETTSALISMTSEMRAHDTVGDLSNIM